ncbi:IS630 family transposase [Vibrio navarrensis]
MSLKAIDVWLQDKARFTQQNQRLVYRLTRHKAESRKAAAIRVHLLFDSVCPARGIGEAMVVPWVNKEIMIEHLKQISANTEKGRHAVIIMDGASWHTDDIAEPFSNVSIIKLPPYSPELNPIEQVWSWLRQHYLANQSFTDYEDIVEKVCKAWNRFLDSTDRVSKMCTREWIDLTS